MTDPKKAYVPAPNAYSLSSTKIIQKSAPAFGFGTGKRPQSHNGRVPGPGAYDLKGIVGN